MRKVGILLAIVMSAIASVTVRYALMGWKELLEEATAGADRIQVGPDLFGTEPAVFEVRGKQAVRDFVDMITSGAEEDNGHCMCFGGTAFCFYKGDKELFVLELAHGERLKWPGRLRSFEVRLTKECQVALPQWFQERGYSGLEENRQRRLAEQQRNIQEDEQFAGFFPSDIREIVMGRSKQSDLGGDDRAGREIARLMNDPKAVAIAACRALGVSSRSMSSTSAKERRALAAAATVGNQALLDALATLRSDNRGLCGAASPKTSVV